MATSFFRFTPSQVRTIVPAYSPGVYLLAQYEGTKLISGYVGRSDRCLRRRLTTHNLRSHFDLFTFKVIFDAQQAFLEEAGWWHFLKNEAFLLNKIHPSLPRDTSRQCPYCSTAEQFQAFLDQLDWGAKGL